jgi:hypothetical protein
MAMKGKKCYGLLTKDWELIHTEPRLAAIIP